MTASAAHRLVAAATAGSVALIGFGGAAAAVPSPGLQAESAPIDNVVLPTEWQADPAVGSLYRGWSGYDGLGFGLWTNGSATAEVDVPQGATRMVFEVGGDRCEDPTANGDGPRVLVQLGERLLVLTIGNLDADLAHYVAGGAWPSGPQTVEVSYWNDYRDETCDRNLKFSRLWWDHEDLASSRVHLRASSLTRSPEDAGTLYTKGPEGEPTQLLWANGALRAAVNTQSIPSGYVSVRASAHQCEGSPTMVVRLDDRHVGQVSVGPDQDGRLREYQLPLPFPLGYERHRLTIQLVDDHRTESCDRNLKVGTVSIVAAP